VSGARGAIGVILAVAGSAVVMWSAGVLLIVLAGAWPVLRPADAIVVLGAAQYNGRPSPVFQARLDHALELHRRGLAPRLIFTGGVGIGDSVSEGEVGRRYAMQHGVPDSAILVEREGVTSAQSVAAAAALMRAYELRTALIVSDPFHMLRLEVLSRQAGIRPFRAPTPTSRLDRGSRDWRRYVLRESMLFPASVALAARLR
jgi:uncharacterized SAM-binding protein YcdF (DUF218 family)